MSSAVSIERTTAGIYKANLRPEVELLLCCARLRVPSAARERIMALLELELDWVHLLKLASEHGLLPLLYLQLNALAPAAVPKAIYMKLWAHYESTLRHNQGMARELLNILQMFDANGIPAIAYKGPALAAAVYGDLGLREFGDLDILLRPQDVLPAKRLLRAHGYIPEYDLKPAVEAAFLRSSMQYHLVLVDKARAVMIELHWKTDPDFAVEATTDAQWWADLGHFSLEEKKIRCFATGELLLILCLHGSKHAWGSLGWLVDVAELIRQHPDIGWERITGKAAQLGCERRLALGLYLAHHLLDAPLPEATRNKLGYAADVKNLADSILETLFTPDSEGMSAFEWLRFNLSLYERRREKFNHCINVVLAPSLVEWSNWPLPRALFFLYLPLRVGRLIRKYTVKMLSGAA